MDMPGRKYSAAGIYRYGFNGKENDNEVKGEGNQQDYGMRIYDPWLGRFLSVDPLFKGFSWNSPYSYAEGDVIRCIDLDGLEKFLVIYLPEGNTGIARISITTVGNINSQTIENMKIVFNDKSPNDQSKDVLRIRNGFKMDNPKGKRDQHNDISLSQQEQFLLDNGLEPQKNEKAFHISVSEPLKDKKTGKIIEDQEIDVGIGRDFSPTEFVQGVSEGFGGGKNFKAGAFKTYDDQVATLLDNIKKVAKTEKLNNVRIDITYDGKTDKVLIDSYTDLLKKKYGSDVEIVWTKSKDNNKISTRTKGKNDANISITVIK
jgi:RHS repeat-associated protein